MKKLITIPFLLILFIFTSSFTFINKSSSYIVLDKTTNRILEGSNYNTQFLVASTAKILTAITVIENYNLNETITISKEDTLEVGSKVYLKENEEITRLDLLYALMLRSANDAASALSNNNSKEFILLMNETAKKIGMYNSCFSNASGLDEREYNLSTAYDMALLSSYAAKNEVFLDIAQTHSIKVKTNMTNYNFINKHKLVNTDDNFIWGKTGYTKKSKRILVSNYKNDNLDLIIVTINDSNDWSTHKNLSIKANNYNFVKVLSKGLYDTKLDITYYLYIKEDLIIPLKNNECDNIKIIFRIYEDIAYVNVYLLDELILSKELDIYYKNTFNPEILIDYLN